MSSEITVSRSTLLKLQQSYSIYNAPWILPRYPKPLSVSLITVLRTKANHSHSSFFVSLRYAHVLESGNQPE